jgi:hypothetical protein
MVNVVRDVALCELVAICCYNRKRTLSIDAVTGICVTPDKTLLTYS